MDEIGSSDSKELPREVKTSSTVEKAVRSAPEATKMSPPSFTKTQSLTKSRKQHAGHVKMANQKSAYIENSESPLMATESQAGIWSCSTTGTRSSTSGESSYSSVGNTSSTTAVSNASFSTERTKWSKHVSQKPPNGQSFSEETTSYRRQFETIKLSSQYNGAITTMLVSGIPHQFKTNALMGIFDMLGFTGKYDCFYMPSGFGKFDRHALVNLVDQDSAVSFQKMFDGLPLDSSKSNKKCSVRPGHIQGLEALEKYFEQIQAFQNTKDPPIFLPQNKPVRIWSSNLDQGFVKPATSEVPVPTQNATFGVDCGQAQVFPKDNPPFPLKFREPPGLEFFSANDKENFQQTQAFQSYHPPVRHSEPPGFTSKGDGKSNYGEHCMQTQAYRSDNPPVLLGHSQPPGWQIMDPDQQESNFWQKVVAAAIPVNPLMSM